MTPLSPAARAVLHAVDAAFGCGSQAVACTALRSAAEQVAVPEQAATEWDRGFVEGVSAVYESLNAIADELDLN